MKRFKNEKQLKHDSGMVFRNIRKAKGLSQVEFAKRCGLTQGFISKIEHGVTEVPLKMIKALRAMKVNINQLIDDGYL